MYPRDPMMIVVIALDNVPFVQKYNGQKSMFYNLTGQSPCSLLFLTIKFLHTFDEDSKTSNI
jgi:hypothetical protein